MSFHSKYVNVIFNTLRKKVPSSKSRDYLKIYLRALAVFCHPVKLLFILIKLEWKWSRWWTRTKTSDRTSDQINLFGPQQMPLFMSNSKFLFFEFFFLLQIIKTKHLNQLYECYVQLISYFMIFLNLNWLDFKIFWKLSAKNYIINVFSFLLDC